MTKNKTTDRTRALKEPILHLYHSANLRRHFSIFFRVDDEAELRQLFEGSFFVLF